MANYKEKLKQITTMIFDYDGVMTDGTVMFLEGGEHGRTGYVKDGYAIQLAVKKGYRVAVMSGAKSSSMAWRCQAIGIEETFLGIRDKLQKFRTYLHENNLKPSEVLFMGDDIPDLQVMKESGLAVCPADAVEEIKAISQYISQFPGGRGCVRDIIEQVMKVQGKWMDGEAYSW